MTKINESIKINPALKQDAIKIAEFRRISKNSVYNQAIEIGLKMISSRPQEEEEGRIYQFEIEVIGTNVVSLSSIYMFPNDGTKLFTKEEIEEIREKFRSLDKIEISSAIATGSLNIEELKEYLTKGYGLHTSIS